MDVSEDIYLIDGSAFIYRAFHAISALTNRDGMPTNAVFGFASMVRRLIKERQPAYLAVAFDSRGAVFRHELYGDYKATRPEMPEALAGQIPYIKELVKALGLVSFEEQGVEADDLIASAVNRLSDSGCRIIIVSGDKDLLQLVGDRVTMWDPMSDKVMDRAAVRGKYHVEPEALLHCFALTGDSSDNVPGVPGIGPKTAGKLVQQYGSLEQLYERLDEMKASKMKQNLIEHRDAAFLSRDLIRLKNDCVVPGEPTGYRLGEADNGRLKELYTKLGFTNLLKEVDDAAPIATDGFRLIRDRQSLNELAAMLAEASLLAVDTETTSLNSRRAELVGISLSCGLPQCWYIPLGHRDEAGELVADQLLPGEVREVLEPYLTSPELPKIGHNLKYDYAVLAQAFDVSLAGPLIDTMIAAYLTEPARRSLKLDDLCREIDIKMTSYEQVTGGNKRDDAFAYVPVEAAGVYSCEDVHGALALWERLQPRLAEKDMLRLFHELEMPLVPILAQMEAAGIKVDPQRLDDLAAEFREKLAAREEEIYRLAGHPFNISSPQQLGVVLFDELGLPHGRKTKTGYSTDAGVLEKLAQQHEMPALIVDYRNLAKLLSTYIEKLKPLIDDNTGRIHTSFNQTVTTTGRLSSSNPNLQNIPIRGEEGGRIREAFVAETGTVFLFADYSQIDLRVLAHYSQDPALLAAFRRGDDIHNRTAAEIFGVSPLLITPDMRRVAKSINFGIVYGMSSFGLANQLRISRTEAQKFIDRYFDLYAGVQQFMHDIVAQAKRDGYVSTLLNRRRYLPEIKASDKARRDFAERAAINTPIQGTAADIIKLAMLRVDELLQGRPEQCRMLLQIHDELIFEIDENQCGALQEDILRCMEQALPLDVPLVVNMQQGHSLAK
jgi:DNA polymerase-1